MKNRGEILPAAGLVLGIETATALGGVALVSDAAEVLGEVTLRNHESHAERILPAAAWLLESLGFSRHALAAVAVSQGPGSFTGLRAGIAAAKGLAFSLGVPLFGIATLDALAANAPAGTALVCAAFGARRGEAFRAHYRCVSGVAERLGPDRLLPLQALAEELPPGCLVLGELPAAFAALIPRGRDIRFAPPHLRHPRAAVIAALGNEARVANRPSQLTSLMPNYLRPWDAASAPATG